MDTVVGIEMSLHNYKSFYTYRVINMEIFTNYIEPPTQSTYRNNGCKHYRDNHRVASLIYFTLINSYLFKYPMLRSSLTIISAG
jgi:hypothetical protein